LDLSKLEAGQMVILPKPLQLKTLFQELHAIFQHSVKEKGLEFRMVAEALPELLLDERHIRQILLNLLGNAIKFTTNGFISLEAQFKYGTLTLKVGDSGCGISPQAQERVFDPFIQEDSGIRGNRKISGTGLGLPIVKRLTEGMGGTIAIDSTPGKGSCYSAVRGSGSGHAENHGERAANGGAGRQCHDYDC